MEHPAPYKTSEAVRNGISLAYSTVYNPRGLEDMWNNPFAETLREVATPYHGELLIYSPSTVWLEADLVKERRLRQAFDDLGLHYDDQPPPKNKQDTSSSHDGQTTTEDEGEEEVGHGHNEGEGHQLTRKSTRLVDNIKKASLDQKKKDKAHLKNLRDQRHALIDKRKAASKIVLEDSDVGNTSIESIQSMHQGGAEDHQPDIFVAHVKTAKLHSPDELLHSAYRGGRKAYHYCGALMVELKSGASRTKKGEKFDNETVKQIKEAVKDLWLYCIAYFAAYPDAKYVTAVATGGVFWSWSKINKDDVLAWDTPSKEQDEDREWLFIQNFEEMFILGTEESDMEWTRINKECIYPLTTDTHSPGYPEANPRVVRPE